jgi:hypothetical protein
MLAAPVAERGDAAGPGGVPAVVLVPVRRVPRGHWRCGREFTMEDCSGTSRDVGWESKMENKIVIKIMAACAGRRGAHRRDRDRGTGIARDKTARSGVGGGGEGVSDDRHFDKVTAVCQRWLEISGSISASIR